MKAHVKAVDGSMRLSPPVFTNPAIPIIIRCGCGWYGKGGVCGTRGAQWVWGGIECLASGGDESPMGGLSLTAMG